MADLYYIVSVQQTKREQPCITLWTPDARGYCFSLSRAGKYALETVLALPHYYNSGSRNVAVPCPVLDDLGAEPPLDEYHYGDGLIVPNTRASWAAILASLVGPPACMPAPEFKGAPRATASA